MPAAAAPPEKLHLPVYTTGTVRIYSPGVQTTPTGCWPRPPLGVSPAPCVYMCVCVGVCQWGGGA